MENKKYYKYNDIDFEVNLTLDKVFEIANDYLRKNDSNRKVVLDNTYYDINDEVLNHPSWNLTIGNDEKCWGIIDNEYVMVISDIVGEIGYIITNHGRIVYI